MLSAEPVSGVMLFEAAHPSDPSLDPTVILLKSIIIRHNSVDATSSL
jgi:hypothetical protein